jgi:hypothetical protein
MKAHISEHTLIDYQFDLLSDEQNSSVAAHLEECSECRQRQEAVAGKFAALDVLKEEVTAPPHVINTVLERVKIDKAQNIFSFHRYRWITYPLTAAAALFVAAVMWNSRPDDLITTAPLDSFNLKENGKESTQKGNTLADSKGRRPTNGLAVTQPDKTGTRVSIAGEDVDRLLSEQPFPPASAIELNVLPRRDNVQLTIYNEANLTMVKEERKLTMKKGWNWLQFMWANTLIDPTSLELEPLEHKDAVEVKELTYPPRLKDLGRWLIASRVSGEVPFALKNFTAGLSWQAFYTGTLSPDERKMQLEGHVRVTNRSGEDYENAEVRLIVGKINLRDKIEELARRKHPYGASWGRDDDMSQAVDKLRVTNGPVLTEEEDVLFTNGNGDMAAVYFDGIDRKEILKEGLSEYFLYSIEGTETIPHGWAKRLPSFDAEGITVSNLYKYDETRWGTQPIRFLSFVNDKDHNLGETPIPNGYIRIFNLLDEQEHLGYAGGASIDYIPVDEDVELNLGPARYVKISPKLMKTATRNYDFNNKGNIIGWEEVQTWEVKVTNARKLPVNVEITRGFSTAKWDIEFSGKVEYTKHDASNARFSMTLPAETKETFGYVLTMYFGTRAE